MRIIYKYVFLSFQCSYGNLMLWRFSIFVWSPSFCSTKCFHNAQIHRSFVSCHRFFFNFLYKLCKPYFSLFLFRLWFYHTFIIFKKKYILQYILARRCSAKCGTPLRQPPNCGCRFSVVASHQSHYSPKVIEKRREVTHLKKLSSVYCSIVMHQHSTWC